MIKLNQKIFEMIVTLRDFEEIFREMQTSDEYYNNDYLGKLRKTFKKILEFSAHFKNILMKIS